MYTWRVRMRESIGGVQWEVRVEYWIRRKRRRFYLVTALTLDAVVVGLLFVVAALL